MNQILYVTYNGETLVPEGNVDLKPNQRYLIYIEPDPLPPTTQKSILTQLADEAIDAGIFDLAEQHDHYLYGVEKQ